MAKKKIGREAEIEFKKQSIDAEKKEPEPSKKKRGRPPGVKNGQGKKKTPRKKASVKTSERKTRLKPYERESIRKRLVEHYGASKIDKATVNAKNMPELDTILLQFKKELEIELEEQRIEVDRYYEQIDREYKKIGRPKSVFNQRELDYLCSIGCTDHEIAGFFQMHVKTLRLKVKEEYGLSFNEYYERQSQGIKVGLRRQQIAVAMAGDSAMLKFLGKNYLGQKDKVDFEGEVKVNSWVDLMDNLESDGDSTDGKEPEEKENDNGR